MRRWWERLRAAPPPEEIELHPAVPGLAEWDRRGIVGMIGSGSAAGSSVAARPIWTDTGAFDCYLLETCDGDAPILDGAGRFVMDRFVVDSRVPGEEGGLIDALTREVDVTWWRDRERIDAFWAMHRG
ncbi:MULTISPECIES: hypothetical protein [Curtobacterium]|uniref:hypothetical protein n=1 Tax=Curtobacterium TaxID=2034 RepID=UPI00128F6589|nr:MULTISPECIES: hypothetical protein [Curtobacterium]UBQ03204.1 hypothetical protein LCG91_03275 [Curtobacterium sp. TXMA1]